MANRKMKKKRLNAEWFTWVLQERGVSIRSLGNPDSDFDTHWSVRSIQRALSSGEITPELLDVIAKRLDVHPDYLAGKYAWALDAMPDEDAKTELKKTCLNPKWYPYYEAEQERLGLSEYWDQTLLMHAIDKKDYLALNHRERSQLRDDFDILTTRLLKKYFPSCKHLNAIEHREVMAWETEEDVIESMLPYFEKRGLIRTEEAGTSELTD